MDTLFEGVYQKLISPDFSKNLGGELPLFISAYPQCGTDRAECTDGALGHAPFQER